MAWDRPWDIEVRGSHASRVGAGELGSAAATRRVESAPAAAASDGADLDRHRFAAIHFEGVARPYFAGSSLILSPPFATGMTQTGVATSAELRSVVYGWLLERS